MNLPEALLCKAFVTLGLKQKQAGRITFVP